MKRILITLLFAFFLIENVFCEGSHKVEIGVHGSPSLVFLWGSKYVNQNSKPTIGYMVGANLQYNFPKIVSLRLEVSYEAKGTKGPTTGSIVMNRTNFQYITVPLLLRLGFGKKIFFFGNTGPYIGLLLRNTVVTQASGMPKETIVHTGDYKRFDTGLAAGLGFGFTILGRLAISLEARQNFGFYDIGNTTLHNFVGTVRTNSTNFIIGVALKI